MAAAHPYGPGCYRPGGCADIIRGVQLVGALVAAASCRTAKSGLASTVIVSGHATDNFIESSFIAYKDEWKNKAIQTACHLLRGHFGGKGRWYGVPTARTYVLGCWFKTSIRGFWVHNDKVYAVLINCRKSQPLAPNNIRFLARGIYELHCIDDPNNPTPLIVDLGQHLEDRERKSRIYEMQVEEAISLEGFESSVREFLTALNIAGIALPPPPDVEHILDLFRR